MSEDDENDSMKDLIVSGLYTVGGRDLGRLGTP